MHTGMLCPPWGRQGKANFTRGRWARAVLFFELLALSCKHRLYLIPFQGLSASVRLHLLPFGNSR